MSSRTIVLMSAQVCALCGGASLPLPQAGACGSDGPVMGGIQRLMTSTIINSTAAKPALL